MSASANFETNSANEELLILNEISLKELTEIQTSLDDTLVEIKEELMLIKNQLQKHNNLLDVLVHLIPKSVTISSSNDLILGYIANNNNFNIRNHENSPISIENKEIKKLNNFIWNQSELYFEGTVYINNHLHYLFNNEYSFKDYYCNVSGHHNFLNSSNIGDCKMEVRGSSDYLYIYNGKDVTREEISLDHVKNIINLECDDIYICFEIKSEKVEFNEKQAQLEFISLINKISNSSHPLLHVTTDLNKRWNISFWDEDGNLNTFKMERINSISFIRDFISQVKLNYGNYIESYQVHGINVFKKQIAKTVTTTSSN